MRPSRKLRETGQLTIPLAYNLFTQKPKVGKADFLNRTKTSKYKQGDDYFRHNGAGETVVFSAADFEDFRSCVRACPRRWRASSRRSCACLDGSAGTSDNRSEPQ